MAHLYEGGGQSRLEVGGQQEGGVSLGQVGATLAEMRQNVITLRGSEALSESPLWPGCAGVSSLDGHIKLVSPVMNLEIFIC